MRLAIVVGSVVIVVCSAVAIFSVAMQYPGADPRRPNAPDQKPAFAGQTRAPVRTANVAFNVVTIAGGLENPWGLAFLPGSGMLVTERPGRLRVVSGTGK